MKDTSIIARIVTTVVIILVIVIGATVLLKREVKYDFTPPDAGPTPSSTFVVYPNNGKE